MLQLGRLVPRKGVDNVIRAVAHAAAIERPVRLVVVGGDSPSPTQPHAEIVPPASASPRRAASPTASRSRAAASADELRACYAAADVFVTTPWYEPFGITPLEAMACGTPVIGSAVGGIQHSVVDGVTGYLVPPRDPAALAGRLAPAAGRSRRRRRDGPGRRVPASAATSPGRRVAEALEAAYAAVLPRPTSRAARRHEPARHARGGYPVRVARAASA